MSTLHSCKREPVEVPKNTPCENFPEHPGGIHVFYKNFHQYKAPTCNPNNIKEFAYVHRLGNETYLVTDDMSNSQKDSMLIPQGIIEQPKWGQNGKILFVNRYHQPCWVDSDSLKTINVISSDRHFLYPDWLSDSTVICEYSPNLGNPYVTKILNINTLKSETIEGKRFTMGSVNSRNQFLAYLSYEGNPNITFETPSRIKVLSSDSFSGKNTIAGICWSPIRNMIYYSTVGTGVWSINPWSSVTNNLVESCDTRSYRHLSLTADGQNIIIERVNAYDFDSITGSWEEQSVIEMMTINGDDREIIVP
ncbi:hypothetical protein GYB22_00980 [bacterium]|nr:hypothetical protein [bacterium]